VIIVSRIKVVSIAQIWIRITAIPMGEERIVTVNSALKRILNSPHHLHGSSLLTPLGSPESCLRDWRI